MTLPPSLQYFRYISTMDGDMEGCVHCGASFMAGQIYGGGKSSNLALLSQ